MCKNKKERNTFPLNFKIKIGQVHIDSKAASLFLTIQTFVMSQNLPWEQ